VARRFLRQNVVRRGAPRICWVASQPRLLSRVIGAAARVASGRPGNIPLTRERPRDPNGGDVEAAARRRWNRGSDAVFEIREAGPIAVNAKPRTSMHHSEVSEDLWGEAWKHPTAKSQLFCEAERA
jgi:hypothetical protein